MNNPESIQVKVTHLSIFIAFSNSEMEKYNLEVSFPFLVQKSKVSIPKSHNLYPFI